LLRLALILSISISLVAGITGMSYHDWFNILFSMQNFLYYSLLSVQEILLKILKCKHANSINRTHNTVKQEMGEKQNHFQVMQTEVGNRKKIC
jgi:hypothetical protein